MKTDLINILTSFSEITFALLFGSYAKETQTDLSDIYIAIYTSEPIDLLRQGEMIAILEEKFNKRIDLILLNDLYKFNARLSFNIIDNHLVLISKDNDKYVDFKTNALLYYLDISPMYEMFDSNLTQRIKSGTYGKVKAS